MNLSGIAGQLSPPLLRRAVTTALAAARESRAGRLLTKADRLHLGCGTNVLPGWVNVDQEGGPGVVALDLTRPLPIAGESMAFIFTEHFIEHVEHDTSRRLFREWHRVLRPGGVLRISTPSLSVLLDEYRRGSIGYWTDMQWTPSSPCQMVNEGMRMWGHQFLFDAAELEADLRAAGFKTVAAVQWRESAHQPLRGLECRAFHGDLIYEATR